VRIGALDGRTCKYHLVQGREVYSNEILAKKGFFETEKCYKIDNSGGYFQPKSMTLIAWYVGTQANDNK
jgi:hypothetical protein